MTNRLKLCPDVRITINSLEPDSRDVAINAPNKTAIGNV